MVFGIGSFKSYSLVTPNKEGDFKDFMGVILTVPYEELKPVLDAHSKLKG